MRAIGIIHKTTTWLILVVGVIHVMATFYFFKSLTEGTVWFVGAGLGGIFISFLNMSLWRDDAGKSLRVTVDIGNLLFAIWLVLGVKASAQPPSFVIAGIGITMAISGILSRRQ